MFVDDVLIIERVKATKQKLHQQSDIYTMYFIIFFDGAIRPDAK